MDLWRLLVRAGGLTFALSRERHEQAALLPVLFRVLLKKRNKIDFYKYSIIFRKSLKW